ncbi:DNA-directed DNA polymerase [Tanacetum coccineum]
MGTTTLNSYLPVVYDGGHVIFGSNLKGKVIGEGQLCDDNCIVSLTKVDYTISKNGKTLAKVLNKEIIRIEESLNVTFDESLPKPKSSPSIEDGRIIEPVYQDSIRSSSVDSNALEPGYPKNLKEAKCHPIEQVIGELNERTLRFVDFDSSAFLLPDICGNFNKGTLLDPFQFLCPKRKLTIEEMNNNELLLKERNNSLIELKFEVYGLSRAIEKAQIANCEIKGLTSRGGKTTTKTTHNTNIANEPPVPDHDKPVTPREAPAESKPQKAMEQVIKPQISPIPFPRRLKKEKEEAQQRKFLENLKQLQLNIPFIEALTQMPKYAKFLKSLLSNKTRLEEACTVTINKRCSAVLLNKLPLKEKVLGSFTIPCDIGNLHIDNALADLGASISLMPYSMYEKLGLCKPKPTRMSLELVDRSIQYPRGIAEHVPIKVDKSILPIDFVILDMREDSKIMIILGRNEEVIFDVDQSIKKLPVEDDECYGIDDLDQTIHLEAQELIEDDQTDSFLLNDLEKCIDQTDSESCEEYTDSEKPIRRIEQLDTAYSKSQGTQESGKTRNEHLCSASASEIDEKKPELKDLPSHLEYAYLKGDKTHPVIISSKLTKKEKVSLLQVLEKHEGAIAQKMSDIKGINMSFCTHKILMEESFKPVIQLQRRLNLKDQDVVKNKIVKLLNSGLIYPILDNLWVSPNHVVPTKGGIIVVLNDNNELIISQTVTRWRVSSKFQSLQKIKKKQRSHVPMELLLTEGYRLDCTTPT